MPRLIVSLFAFLLALPSRSNAQKGHDLFQQAMVLETVRGDLPAAMALYQRILREHREDRPLQARALIQLGHGYELLGRPEALTTYEQVVEEFADQGPIALMARARITDLRGGTGSDPTHLLLLSDAHDDGSWRPTEFDFSPDGAAFVIRTRPDADRRTGEFSRETPALYLGNRDGRLPRLLWSSRDSAIGAPSMPRWSPDGRLIAFMTRPAATTAAGERAILHVIPASGGPARQIGAPVPGRVWDLRWTPDGRLAWHAGRGVQVRGLDGTTTTMSGTIAARSSLGGVSPDGRWLAVSQRDPNGISIHDRDIWLLDATTGVLHRITDRPGFDGFPVWGKDGSLLFISSRSGARNVWRVAIDSRTGRPADNPRQVTFYLDADVGHLQAAGASIGFTLIRSTSTVYVAPTVEGGSPSPVARGNQPVLSPDGATLFYVTPGSIHEDYRPVSLAAAPRSGGESRVLATNVVAPTGAGRPGYDLSGDGRSIAFVGVENDGRALQTVGTAGGTPRVLARLKKAAEVIPAFSPDGMWIGFADGTDLFVVRAAGGEPRRIATLAGGFEAWSLRWSLDGKRIGIFGYPSTSPGGNNAVFVVSADGSDSLRQVSPADHYKEGLDWDPTGERLTYHLSLRNSRTAQTSLATGGEKEFHDEPEVWDYRGRWAPDRRSYYFEGTPDNSTAWQVYRLDTRTGTSTRFAGNNASLPTWSRDGRFMAWRESPTSSQLWLLEDLP